MPLLAIYSEDTVSAYHRDTCHPWSWGTIHNSQVTGSAQGLLTDEWIKRIWYMWMTELYLVMKNKMIFLMEMDHIFDDHIK